VCASSGFQGSCPKRPGNIQAAQSRAASRLRCVIILKQPGGGYAFLFARDYRINTV